MCESTGCTLLGSSPSWKWPMRPISASGSALAPPARSTTMPSTMSSAEASACSSVPAICEDLLAQVARRLVHGLAADRHRPRAEGAAAVGRGVGVAGDHPHAAPSARRAPLAAIWPMTVSVPWPCSVTPTAQMHAAVGLELDDAGILQRDRRAADAVVAVRPRRRALDEGGDADAAVDALLAQPRLLCAQLRIAHALDERVDAALVRHVLELDAAAPWSRDSHRRA